MVIKGCKTVAEYREERRRRIELWFSFNFEPGFFTCEILDTSVIVTDLNGDFVEVSFNEIF